MRNSIRTLIIASVLVAGPVSAACVNVPEANLRSGPGTQHEKSWEVFKYMPLKVISQKGDWSHVSDVDGDTHWIYRKLLTEGFTCAVVKGNKVNVRSGPGIQHAVAPLGQVDKYYAFKVLSNKGDWLEVEDEMKNRGWISESLVWVN
jgi:SH3-like domain-containing protein